MRRVFEDRAYRSDSLDGCFWLHDDPRPNLQWPRASGLQSAQVAIIGAGYTGLSAALHLAQQGVEVAVFDMHAPGWGASGRSGGFCCLGGAMAGAREIQRRFGENALREWDIAQQDAVGLVRRLIDRHAIAADTHSTGETQLAHSRAAYRRLYQQHGHKPGFIKTHKLAQHGMRAQGLLGGYTEPVGFALQPRKYVLGLAQAAQRAGARIFAQSGIENIEKTDQGFTLKTRAATVRARKLIVATNGYSHDDLPDWLRARFMPVQSNILVTRELTPAELATQGWTTDQMVYDTRKLLHYFRLLPDRRMMFGMRGGFRATKASDRHMHRLIRRDFDAMFPAWRGVETPWFWSGLVCLTAKRVPFVGPIPEMPGAYAGFGWHGNGIAMGTYAGKLLADLAVGSDPRVPRVLQDPPMRMPFGRRRRLFLPPIYKGLAVRDWLR